MRKKAVLIIHGFAGGTYDQEKLAFYLELNGFDVYTFTLPGHEKLIYGKVKKEKWIESCENHLQMLIDNKYKDISVVGHSMGGVLASYLAYKYSKNIKRLVLLAPAFKYLTFENDEFKMSSVIKNSPKIINTYSKGEVFSRVIKFPSSVVKEFMDLVNKFYDLPSLINCKSLIIQGANDDIVPVKSSEYVYENLKSKNKKIYVIDNITHDIFKDGNNIEYILNLIKDFLNDKN